MGGMHNVENSIAAIAVARQLNIEWDKIKLAVDEFKGVKRRFEYIIRNSDIVFIDDYAHHPEELRALINGAKALYKNKRCTVVFQPHLFSRTKDLAAEFAKVLDLAHEVILLPIYPAREQPMPGVSSSVILDRMYSDDKHIMTKEELLNWIKTHEVELFITAGAGDIDTLVRPLKEILSQTT
jgi:UDP-N-acetylmuramate--alanine ligase